MRIVRTAVSNRSGRIGVTDNRLIDGSRQWVDPLCTAEAANVYNERTEDELVGRVRRIQ